MCFLLEIPNSLSKIKYVFFSFGEVQLRKSIPKVYPLPFTGKFVGCCRPYEMKKMNEWWETLHCLYWKEHASWRTHLVGFHERLLLLRDRQRREGTQCCHSNGSLIRNLRWTYVRITVCLGSCSSHTTTERNSRMLDCYTLVRIWSETTDPVVSVDSAVTYSMYASSDLIGRARHLNIEMKNVPWMYRNILMSDGKFEF